VVDVLGLTDRSTAVIYTPSPGRNQVWHVTPLGKERYRFSPVGAPGEALTVIGPRNNSGDGVGQVGLYKYIGDPSQQWILTPVNGPYFQFLVAAQTKAVLDVNARGTKDGSDLIAYPNKGASSAGDDNQQFGFEPAP
jgi:hypothetical protein